jgi:hypothetical protein
LAAVKGGVAIPSPRVLVMVMVGLWLVGVVGESEHL